MKNIKDVTDLTLLLERFFKTGRMSFTLLTWDRKEEAQVNELIVNYEQTGEGNLIRTTPRLYIRNIDGDIVPITSMPGDSIEVFKEHFLDIGVVRESDYKPNIWCMLKEETDGTTGFTKGNIKQFYKYIDDNYTDLRPYMLNTETDSSGKNKLVPFISSKAVFYDVGRVLNGAQIENMEDVFKMLWDMVVDMRRHLEDLLKDLADIIKAAIKDLNDVLSDLNNKLDDLTDLAKKNSIKIDVLIEKAEGMDSDLSAFDLKVKSREITIGGKNTELMAVKFRLENTDDVAMFMNTFVLDIPMGLNAEGGDGGSQTFRVAGDGLKFSTPETTYTISSTTSGTLNRVIYDVIFTKLPAPYELKVPNIIEVTLILRGDRKVTMYSKYVDKYVVTQSLYSATITAEHEKNKVEHGIGEYVRTFSNNVAVVKELTFLNRYVMRLVK